MFSKCFNIFRNAVLESSMSELGYKPPNARKTGTTIAGLVFKVNLCEFRCEPAETCSDVW